MLRFGIQAIQQETFFFTLPFFLHTTTWTTGQAAFTTAAMIAALCSMWDPLYFGRIAQRPWLYLAFHALAVFVGTLTVAPVLLHLTTSQTAALASAAVAVLAVPSLWQVIERQRPLHWVLLFGGSLALGALSWELRSFVPPATLWIHEGLVTASVNAALRAPGAALASVTPAQVHAHGLYAFTAIRAPRGLHERVYHRWLQNGVEVDRIALELVGGRAEGFRAWSYKRGFPADPRGDWLVQVMTEGGQLIGQLRFGVSGELPARPPQPQPPVPPPTELPAQEPATPSVEAPAEAPTQPPPAELAQPAEEAGKT